MGNIIFGLIIIAVGFLATWKAHWITENFGRDEWAESKLSGGTPAMYRMIGIAMIFFGILLTTGLLKNVLVGIFGSIFGI